MVWGVIPAIESSTAFVTGVAASSAKLMLSMPAQGRATWTTVGRTRFATTVAPLVGLAVTSHEISSLNTARFERLSR